MNSLLLPPAVRIGLAFLGLAFVGALTVSADTVTLTATDASGSSSFNSAGHWSNSAAPSAGNDYVVSGTSYLLRTPSTTGSYTFAGNSLTLSNSNNVNGGLIVKSPGASTITINNLTLDGGSIRDGNGASDTITLLGSINITSNGGILTMQETWIIGSAISGTGNLTVSASSRALTLSGTNTWTGNLNLGTGTNDTFTLASTGTMTFSIGANGVNNAILGSGATAKFNGSFNFNLSSADATLGNQWSIVSSTLTSTYGSTFAVTGFTQNGTLWTSSDGVYQYNETTGILSVVSAIPEPATYGLLAATAALCFVIVRRRKTR